jgi:hypothetical protein
MGSRSSIQTVLDPSSSISFPRAAIPMETFDLMVADGCDRPIYNFWGRCWSTSTPGSLPYGIDH